jgi:hypothetical protein
MRKTTTFLLSLFAISLFATAAMAQQAKPTQTPLSVPTGSGGSVPTPKAAAQPTPTPERPVPVAQSTRVAIEVKGPGVLYIFRTKTGLDFVVKNGDKATLVHGLGQGKIIRTRESYFLHLSKDITGISYSDDIKADDISPLQFTGQAADCPVCDFTPVGKTFQLPADKRIGKYYEQPAAYETVGKSLEDPAVKKAFEAAMKRIERIRRPSDSKN